MPTPPSYRPKPGEIPIDPGVYRFRDAQGRVIYVGKAKSLRSRLSSYFQDMGALHPRTATMVATARSVEWTVVRTDLEALQLEYTWIKEFAPRFNVKYRDDKSYPYLAVTLSEEFPRALVMRGAKRKGTKYFGPYGHAWAIRETLDLLLRVFPIRTCSNGVFKRAAASGRPCLLGYIDKCSAPCVGRVDAAEHRRLVDEFCDFMGGNTAPFIRRVEVEMKTAAKELDFERAARLRDDLGALKTALEKQAVVLREATDADVYAIALDELEAAVQVFNVRGGRIRGQRGWVVEKEDASTGELIEHLLQQVYGDAEADQVPREVLLPELPDNVDDIVVWLSERRGSQVSLRVPQRGDKRSLLDTVHRNAEQSLARHKVARAGDLTKRSQALNEIQEMLQLSDPPLRIECFDIAHVSGSNVVGSMVVFEDGVPRKSEYRRFIVAEGSDDTAAMREVLTRRFKRMQREQEDLATAGGVPSESGAVSNAPADGSSARQSGDTGSDSDGAVATAAPARFAYPPSLLVVDGAGPQVSAAADVLAELGITDLPVIGLAKRLEEVWFPDNEFPVILPRTSEGLYLLQRVRDEAHRFANTFHRARRSAAMTRSALDDIPGLGPARQKALLTAFGSVKKLAAASVEEIGAVKGIGPALASQVQAELSSPGTNGGLGSGVNLTTGEVLE